MASFPRFFITKKIPSPKTIRALLRGPLTGLSALVYGIFFLLCAAIFILLVTLNNQLLVTVPARGSNLTEGVIGAPHFINPLLATTDTDNRLVALVYGSSMNFVDSYTVSPDGKIYTLTLTTNNHFSDGKPLTAEDVAFTVQKMQDVTLSTTSSYWENIAVENPDVNTVVFTLPVPDTSFLSHISFGILPKHVWENISDQSFGTAEQNLHPIGAGPFKVSIVKYTDGIPSSVVLRRNTYTKNSPALLRTLTLASFANQSTLVDALNNNDVDFSYSLTSNALAHATLNHRLQKNSVATNKTVSIYRSPSDTAMSNPTTIAALTQIVDKNAIIATVLNGYGTPSGELSNTTGTKKVSLKGFSLAVENDPQLLLAAQTLAQQLQSIGITVSVKAYDPGAFQKNITAGTYSLFLARNGDLTIPEQYTVALPLYTESLPYVFTKDVHTSIPNTVESPMMEYDSVTDWYSHTDKLWKWFIRKTNNTHEK